MSGQIQAAVAALEAIVATPLDVLTDDEACARVGEIEHLGRLIDAARISTAAELDERVRRDPTDNGLARRHGVQRGVALLERIARVSGREAGRRVKLGAKLAPRHALDGTLLPAEFEHVAAAVRDGEVGVDAAGVIVRHLGDAARTASPTDLHDAEAVLVDSARTNCADLVTVQAKVWRQALDPDGAEPREEALRQHRRFTLGREIDGMTPFHGLADPHGAALIRAALLERTTPSQPRFLDPDDPAQDEVVSEEGRYVLDRRTRAQRDYDVFIGLLTAGIRTDRDHVGSLHGTATVTAVIRAEDLATGTGIAWLDDITEPITATTAQQIVCDGGIRVLIIGNHGEPLWLGRRERYFTPAQRKALAARDGGCIWPQCHAPPARCHAHHVIKWEHGGPTDIDNGVLLCPFHHHLLHTSDYRIRIIGGRPHLLSPTWLDPQQKWRPLGTNRTLVAA